jgi:uncharacterized protein YidB (DUF937 family)
MGILDDLLGGLAGQAMGGRANAPATRAGSGAGMSQVLMALMPIVLGMLANRGSRGGSRTQTNSAPGSGGLGGLLEQLQRTGFREQADSWVSRGANRPISPDAMSQIFGKDGLEAIARQAGISPDEASHGLSELLPEVVDRVTPDGAVPDPDALANSVDDFARRLGLGR